MKTCKDSFFFIWHTFSSPQTTLVVAPEDGGAFCSCCRGENRCTVARAKTCAKIFLAQLFSHVGLCALVVGYAIMGAFIFMALERGKEFETRSGKTSISPFNFLQ